MLDDCMVEQKSTTHWKKARFIRFVIYDLSYHMLRTLNISHLPEKLEKKLIIQAMMREVPKDFAFYRRLQLPFLQKYLIPSMKYQIYPAQYLLADNENLLDPIVLRIVIEGSIRVGYRKQYRSQNIIRRDKIDAVSCGMLVISWGQFLWQTKSVHPYFRVETWKRTGLYEVDLSEFKRVREIRRESKNFMARNDHSNNYTEAHDAGELQLDRFQEKYQIAKDHQLQEMFSNQCWLCEDPNHLPYNCGKYHYVPSYPEICEFQQYRQKRQPCYRRSMLSKKIRKKRKIEEQEASIFNQQKWIMQKRAHLLKMKVSLTMELDLENQFEKYEHFEQYNPAYNLPAHRS